MPQKTINAAADGDNVILDMATANFTAVMEMFFSVTAAGTVIVKDEAGTEFGRYRFGADGGTATMAPMGDGAPRFQAKGDLILTNSAGLDVLGHFTYSTRS